MEKDSEPLVVLATIDPDFSILMDGEGFEPSKSLTTDLQSAPFGRSGIHPKFLI